MSEPTDTDRLRWIANEAVFDDLGTGLDIHDRAAQHADNLCMGAEPTADNYLQALRDIIDELSK